MVILGLTGSIGMRESDRARRNWFALSAGRTRVPKPVRRSPLCEASCAARTLRSIAGAASPSYNM